MNLPEIKEILGNCVIVEKVFPFPYKATVENIERMKFKYGASDKEAQEACKELEEFDEGLLKMGCNEQKCTKVE